MPNSPFCPVRSGCKEQGRTLKHFWISVCFCGCQKLFLSLSPYQNLLMFCLWCGKLKAIIWAMLSTGVYKCTRDHLHYTCPSRKHLIYPLICFKWSYLMLSVLEIWRERDISSLWWISILFPRKAAAGNASQVLWKETFSVPNPCSSLSCLGRTSCCAAQELSVSMFIIIQINMIDEISETISDKW